MGWDYELVSPCALVRPPSFSDSNHLHPSRGSKGHRYWSSLLICFLCEIKLIPDSTICSSQESDIDLSHNLFHNLRMHIYESPYVFTAQIISVCVNEGSLVLALT